MRDRHRSDLLCRSVSMRVSKRLPRDDRSTSPDSPTWESGTSSKQHWHSTWCFKPGWLLSSSLAPPSAGGSTRT